MKRKPLLISLLIWLALAIFFGAIGVVVLDWPKWHGLSERGVEVEGKVTAKEPENHMFIHYTYDVGGETYAGLGSGGGINPEFEKLKIGDRVRVFYDSDRPKVSTMGDPREEATSMTFGVGLLTIAGSLFAMIGLSRKGWLPKCVIS